MTTPARSTRREKEPAADRPFLVSVIGPSGSGKTTLLEGLIAELAGRGIRVAAIKHSRSLIPGLADYILSLARLCK